VEGHLPRSGASYPSPRRTAANRPSSPRRRTAIPPVPINYHLADATHAAAALTFPLNRVKATRLADRAIRLGYVDQRSRGRDNAIAGCCSSPEVRVISPFPTTPRLTSHLPRHSTIYTFDSKFFTAPVLRAHVHAESSSVTAFPDEKIVGTAPSVGIIYRRTIESGQTRTCLDVYLRRKRRREYFPAGG